MLQKLKRLRQTEQAAEGIITESELDKGRSCSNGPDKNGTLKIGDPILLGRLRQSKGRVLMTRETG